MTDKDLEKHFLSLDETLRFDEGVRLAFSVLLLTTNSLSEAVLLLDEVEHHYRQAEQELLS